MKVSSEYLSDTVLRALRTEAAGGAPTGLRAVHDDGTLTITHGYHLIHATQS